MVRRALLPGLLVILALHTPAAQSPTPSVLVSRQLAEAEHVSVGDIVTLAADANGNQAQQFHVAGVYEPVPDPMRLNSSKHEARLHLPDLLALTANPADPLATETVDAVNIALGVTSDAEEFSRDLMARVPGLIAQPVRAAAYRTGSAETAVSGPAAFGSPLQSGGE